MRKIPSLFFATLLLAAPAASQDEPGTGAPPQQDQEPEHATQVAETVVTASGGFAREKLFTPATIHLLGGDAMRARARSFPEALERVPSVMVQKTAYGQSSPYIRGVTSYHNVLLVDGVRLNHAAMRSGPNQYWSLVDLYGIDRAEVLSGPQGVLYGSSAVGGVVQALSPDATFSQPGGGVDGGGGAYLRWSSAESSFVGRLEGEVHDENWSLQAGQTIGLYGDLRGGDTVGTQDETGYDFFASDLKLSRRLGDNAQLTLGVQRVVMDDVPRTHKTIDGITWKGLERGSEIDRIHDQSRELIYLRSAWEDMGGWADAGSVTLSLHRHGQTRDRMKGSGGVATGGDYQGFDLDDLGLAARLEADGAWNDRWSYGVEIHREDLSSFKRTYDANRMFTGTEIQGPLAADATYTTLAAYVQDEIFLSDSWSLVTGLRAERIDVDVDRAEDPDTGNPTSFERDYDAVVGSLRALYRVTNESVVYGGLSQGFRAPSLYDLTSLDETSVSESPDFDLDAEHFLQAELGSRGESGRLTWEGAVYRTWITDLIVRNPEAATGGDVLKENSDGWIHGIEAMLGWQCSEAWRTEIWGAWMDGEVDQRLPAPGAQRVTRSITRKMPLQGRLAAIYQPEPQGWWGEAYVWAVDAQYDLSLRDERDTSRIPDRDGDGFADGTPGYTIVGVRGGWPLHDQALLTVALENLGDVDYRVHGSGVNGPGLNLILGLELRF